METFIRRRTMARGVSTLLPLLILLDICYGAVDRSSWIPVYPLIPLGQEVEYKATVGHRATAEPRTTARRWSAVPDEKTVAPPEREEGEEPLQAVTDERLETTVESLDTTILEPGGTFDSGAPGTATAGPIISRFEETSGSGQVRLTSSDDFYAEYGQGEIAFVSTSGREENCQFHKDCYQSREPMEWCPPMEETHYSNRGCFCDKAIGKCVIDRVKHGRLEWTNCISMASDPCHIG